MSRTIKERAAFRSSSSSGSWLSGAGRPAWLRGLRVSASWRTGVLVLLAWCALGLWVQTERVALRDPHFSTGYALLAAVVFLAAYHWRKKLPTIGVGTATQWMQAHLLVGWITIGIFAFHAGFRFPSGGLDTALWALFVGVSASGVFGLHLTRAVPKRLAALPDETIYERIPARRRETAEAARNVVLDSVATTDVLAGFYENALGMFFEAPRSWFYSLKPTGTWKRSLLRQASALDRYLTVDERAARDRLNELISRKDDLDYQAALQLRLRVWLFVHIGATYGLLAVSAYHVLLVHAFRGNG